MDEARLSLSFIVSVGATEMTWPLTSRILMVTGQRMSILSPKLPAKTHSWVGLTMIGNGQLRTARVTLVERSASKVGDSIMKASCLVSPESQSLPVRVASGKSLWKVSLR